MPQSPRWRQQSCAVRRSGLLTAVQGVGNLAASAVAGLLWTLLSPQVAFGYLAAWMLLALIGLLAAHQPSAEAG